MRPQAALLAAPKIAAQQWPRLVAAVWRAPPATLAPELSLCLCAELEGDALLLGRWQCAASALGADFPALPVARRATGGRTLRAGDGTLALALVLPHSGALLPDGLPVPKAKIVNRCVRPVLGALAALGVSAGYFGRDFISAGSRSVAYVSWDASRAGPVLLEVLIGFGRALLWDGAYGGRREPADEAPWASLAEVAPAHLAGVPAPERWETALRRGFEERLGVELLGARAAPAPAKAAGWPGPDEVLPPRASALRPIAIGHLEARVEVDEIAERRLALPGARVLGRARLLGDFQADTEGLLDLESSLAGTPALFEAAGRQVDRVYGPRGVGTIVGLRSLTPIAEALVEAAQRGQERPEAAR